MLKNSLIVIFTLLSQFTFAQSSRELFNEANDLYAKKNYEEAAKKYEAIVANGFESSALYYNLGNAYFKIKNIPSAILYYEKAALLDPSNDDIVFNLELARTYTIDKISEMVSWIIFGQYMGYYCYSCLFNCLSMLWVILVCYRYSYTQDFILFCYYFVRSLWFFNLFQRIGKKSNCKPSLRHSFFSSNFR